MPFANRVRADDDTKHASDVNTLIFHKNKLYSGGDDGKVKVWEEDLALIGTVDAHSRSVYSLAASDDTLYSCSNDGTVKAWSLNDLKEKELIMKCESELWKLCYTDNTLYVGDNEGTVRLFVNNKYESLVSLGAPIKGMMVVGNLMYTIRDNDLLITELPPILLLSKLVFRHINSVLLHSSQGSSALRKTIMGRAPVCIAGGKICFPSRSGKDILVYENSLDLDFKEVTQAKDAHEMITNSLCGEQVNGNNLLYSGGWDKILKQWKISGSTIQKQNACPVEMCINALTMGPTGEIYAGGSDGHILRVDAQ